VATSYAVQTTRLTRAAYNYINSTYLVCENDQVIVREHQEMFARMANARVETCSAGYSPMLSKTEMLVRRIVEAVERSMQ
jgi:hypothetical protein